MIAEGCSVKGTVVNSIVSTGCVIGEGAYINKCVLMPGAVIGKNARIEYSIIGERSNIGDNAAVGADKTSAEKWGGISVVGNDRNVDKNTVIASGAIV